MVEIMWIRTPGQDGYLVWAYGHAEQAKVVTTAQFIDLRGYCNNSKSVIVRLVEANHG